MKKIIQCMCILFIGMNIIECVPSNKKKTNALKYPKSWNYNSNWGTVSKKCMEEDHQSPINIITTTAITNENKQDLKINYEQVNIAQLENVGYAINALIDDSAIINYKGSNYTLRQFHFHSDSEHTINGKNVPLELHLVHKDENDQLTVLGILFKEGTKNEVFQQFLDSAPTNKTSIDYNQSINIVTLVPQKKSFYSYDGSLTTPGCDTIVNWLVFSEPLTVSAEQIAQFLVFRSGQKNNRVTQNIGTRVVNFHN
ncbi:MAG: carbonic anhydrase family protein [Spirochaetota bacterium]|nr:carbonic anhydrase family protein [Spirochaetota bacterium]